ncbi:poly(A) polymerase [Isoalcanivorax pacificus W11-5]|uniref:Poly(A) polymerase I n=1 Tax=Isoalcanivorax pacificus W11-5 TaxID=391936 RepID=A0A0B4XSZ6_9GAMM|nr:polynucleotide adenylyltransferase PcnB [Isoalcanivorax pacificus]AJD49598.1 poly(A) polymerase [Isoalcanivorax pacificus W11-5]
MPRQYPDPLRRFCRFLTRPFRQGSAPQRRIIPRDEHDISRQDFSRAALHVLYGLKDAGFEAYLVGGCLRDILTGIKPKDFDVVTNAHPEEIERVFRGARIIGRRFRLVHVRFKGEVIEVATFRAVTGQEEDEDDRHSRRSAGGQILRDNVYGTIEEDALRRDFTCNALYYDIRDFSLHDFADSLRDIEHRTLRLIGDPEQRYREDPVRMIRAVRFAAKLDFSIDPATEEPLARLAPLLQQVPSARLFEEVLKLFLSGQGQRTFALLQKHHLFDALFPATAEALDDDDGASDLKLIHAAMRNTDRRLAQEKPVTPAFLFAVLLWPALRRRVSFYLGHGMPPLQAMNKAAGQVIADQVGIVAIPRRYSAVVREIWDLQSRLPRRAGNRAAALMEHPRFRAAYDFLLLREEAGEIKPGLGEWWTRFQEAGDEARDDMLAGLGRQDSGPQNAPRKRRRRRRRSGGGASDNYSGGGQDE